MNNPGGTTPASSPSPAAQEKQTIGGVTYAAARPEYFEQRQLRRYAGVASLWALGVGAVISGHYSGWNLGLMAGGWGGFALAGAGRGVRDGEVSSSCRTAGLQRRIDRRSIRLTALMLFRTASLLRRIGPRPIRLPTVMIYERARYARSRKRRL